VKGDKHRPICCFLDNIVNFPSTPCYVQFKTCHIELPFLFPLSFCTWIFISHRKKREKTSWNRALLSTREIVLLVWMAIIGIKYSKTQNISTGMLNMLDSYQVHNWTVLQTDELDQTTNSHFWEELTKQMALQAAKWHVLIHEQNLSSPAHRRLL
jgi:hypothetical protein